jgi:alkyl sulfatase BDS1-like metallo-beta-lactamase superfamily hydrolase
MTLSRTLLALFASAGIATCAVAQEATEATKAANAATLGYLPFDDKTDFENARRGFIATLEDPVIKTKDGTLVYDTSLYNFMDVEPPETVNPSLWRQGSLTGINGLFEVVPGIYQVRGFDLANMSLIRGETGWIVVDPCMSTETAAAGLKLLRQHVEDLPVTGVIITHSHIDHFGGVKEVADPEKLAGRDVPVIVPEGFFIESVNENLMAGNQMSRRAMYMYGNLLPKSPLGTLGSGLGTTTSSGTHTIVDGNVKISANPVKGEEPTVLTVDGLELIFRYTPEAEAPAELMFYIPKHKALMQAEIINHNLHNLYTLRGAQVRNGLLWSKYIHDTIMRYGGEVEVSFGSHHWPTWGNEQILDFWKGQRDTYRYIHDEVLRLANHGMTLLEVAEEIELPDSLAQRFANRGYYGSVSHNAKSQYQLYFGWFTGNPSELYELPPTAEAKKFVEYSGGADAVIEKARADYEAGDYRWVATALNHVVFADPNNAEAKNLLADALTQLGYQAESGPWRNFFLTGAKELRDGVKAADSPIKTSSPDIVRGLALETYLDYLAVRLNGPKAARAGGMSINLTMPDVNEKVGIVVENGVMNYSIGHLTDGADVSVTMDRALLDKINLGETTVDAAVADGSVGVEGDAAKFGQFISLLDSFELYYNIVTP